MAKTPTKEAEKAKPEPAKADETKIAPNPVEATDPYPTGSPPDPEDQFAAAHGYRREQPKE